MGQIADDILCGFQCSVCGVCFHGEHGHPVLCSECYDDEHKHLNEGRKPGHARIKPELPKATIEEC